MRYNFDEITDRRHTDCEKWNVAEHELPMWVADMDFQAAPEILEAIRKRAAHGIFGYQSIPERWNLSYVNWWKRRYGFAMEKEWLLFCTGVVPAISSIIRKLSTPADKILVQTPVYHMFFRSILNNGRQIADSPLLYDGGEYRIDFADLEKKLADPQVTMFILCNPHNPGGKIWSREELERIGELCKRNNVLVIADEIHCDLTDPGCAYIPFASVSEACRENSVTCIAPTKTFNIAGLQTAAVAVSNEALRHKIRFAMSRDGIGEPGVFAIEAAVAAYEKGEDWLEALREYVFQNKKTAEAFLAQELPEITLSRGQATYLLWVDCGKIAGKEDMARFIRKETGLYLSPGGQFGENGKQFMRMNIACPRSVLTDGLHRLKEGIERYSLKNHADALIFQPAI